MKNKFRVNRFFQWVGMTLALSPFVAMLVYCIVLIYRKVDGIYDWVVTFIIVMFVGMVILFITDEDK